ncbi:MAG TPA: cytosolic protein [Bacillota bacterium]|nr:cytosolic protein [Bacillota bacterium]
MSKNNYTPLSTEFDQTRTLFPEEFPEGPYGSMSNFDFTKDEWKADMHSAPRFTYETRGFHENLSREDEGSHPTHDDPNQSEQPPYDRNYGATDM